MSIDYAKALEYLREEPERVPFRFSDKDAMLYALGIGMGRDPLDARELPFVYEGRPLRIVPSFATVLAHSLPIKDAKEQFDLNVPLVLHGEQSLELHGPLLPGAELTAEVKLKALFDKGKDKGAVLYHDTILRDAATARPLVTLGRAVFARGDGGFGGPSAGQPEPHAVPTRKPDMEVAIETTPGQALLYRLNGDRNPLHADPLVAKSAGFDRPILHGLCTYGIACRAILQAVADFDPTRIKAHACRFSAPVFPGETVVTRLWIDGEIVSFEAYVPERSAVTVLRNGKTVVVR